MSRQRRRPRATNEEMEEVARLAAAMVSLGRYNETAGVYSKVLNELGANNAVAKKD